MAEQSATVEKRTVREIHTEAMKKYMDGYIYEHTQPRSEYSLFSSDAYRNYVDAYYLELEAAIMIECRPEHEPTYSILWRSVASIALKLGWDAQALDAAVTGLKGNPRPDDRAFLKGIVECKITRKNWDWEKRQMKEVTHGT